MYSKIESFFNVVYPDNENATYFSLLNYSSEGDDPFQRWYRYKEGFSVKFVNKIVEEYKGCKGKNNYLLDPFAGSGTTIIAANRLGYNAIGYEINPFSFFLMKTKVQEYGKNDIDAFIDNYRRIIGELKNNDLEEYSLPELSISNKVFQPEAEKYMMSCKTKINKLKRDKVWDLLFMGWLSCIEELSNYRKAGNGLKKRKTIKPLIISGSDVIKRLEQQYAVMEEDLSKLSFNNTYNNRIINDSSINFVRDISPGTIDGIIFSPPYANCFDYTEIYKLELWFGDFVKSYAEMKNLRNSSLRSHLNVKYTEKDIRLPKSELFNSVIDKVSKADLWDKRIPKMLNGYFDDMFNIIDNCFRALKKDGFCAIVVGNSAYGGVIVPTDLILADYANKIGFVVDKIEVDRYIITSSQQYEKTKNQGKYLRESVICLKKK